MNEEYSEFFREPPVNVTHSFGDITLVHSSQRNPFRVYRARKDGKLFILKTVSPRESGNLLYRELLRKEYEIGFLLDHPGIARTVSFEDIAGLGPSIVIDWVDGVTLEEYIRSHKIDRKEAARLLTEICEAVHYLHRRQIVHADLKPANIMVTRDGNHIKLIDFGFSDSPSYYSMKSLGGSASYCAPEQLESSPEGIDTKADIYAIGEIMQRLSSSPSRAWRKVAEKCKSKNPQKRPSDALKIPGYISRLKRRYSVMAAIVCVLIVAVCLALFISKKEKVEEHPLLSYGPTMETTAGIYPEPPLPATTEAQTEPPIPEASEIYPEPPLPETTAAPIAAPPAGATAADKETESVDGEYVRYVSVVDKNTSDTVRKKIVHPMVMIVKDLTKSNIAVYMNRDLTFAEKEAWRDSVRSRMMQWINSEVTTDNGLYPVLLRTIEEALDSYAERHGL